ncbi:AMP-binding protein [Paracoccus xiamenensis]|uniref:AMP-binding protein n=1 Tax=Paracoccus xiamenensis TaxID=2714901 RepID=UPI001407EB5C|nr:AMP-binding protein [Paracoccus xiamenensis]NHF72035.1 AMP-binding protein [Paracoccus xiamenensis]
MSRPYHSIADEIADALSRFAGLTALRDRQRSLTYAELGGFIAAARPTLAGHRAVGVYGVPGVLFGAAVTACVVDGRPFVHLDPAIPKAVLANILAELGISLILASQPPKPGQLPPDCRVVDASAFLESAPAEIKAAQVQPTDSIYLVATSGTTGRPKCIPVTHDAALLSYHWREEYAPYAPGMKVGVYIFAIWEMLRPLRFGAEICFPRAEELLSPQGFVAFLSDHEIHEMLFTPSFLEKILGPVEAATGALLPLRRIILNGEVVHDRLIAQVQAKLPQVTLWNLYSICETHDICMSLVTGQSDGQPGITVGKAMPHLRAVVLDHDDQPCPPGTAGLLHFEGPRMLGPGYVDRPEETARRFRELVIEGKAVRLYDTGDQGIVDDDGQITVLGRVAHMLKLRGHSIQTAELTQTMAGLMEFGQAIPWVRDMGGGDQALVLYYTADADQMARNAERWQISGTRLPEPLIHALRQLLPSYCIPSYLVHLDEIPIHGVSGKCDYKALPEIAAHAAGPAVDGVPPVLAEVARIMRCDAAALDPAQSFHNSGGDSLMCVDLVLALEKAYERRVDFDWALNLPLARLHQLLTQQGTANAVRIDRPGILLTGATGFLGGHVLRAALDHLPSDQVVYCLIRPGNRDPHRRLDGMLSAAERERVVVIAGQIDDPHFGCDPATHAQLAQQVHQVIHCAATVNLAVDRAQMEEWSRAGIRNVLQFCHDAGADLRFSSSTAVFPETGGPFPEAPAQLFPGCSGYGAAKIAAEAEIAASGVPAALVRLPSMYDLDAPNPRDICEIVLAACRDIASIPHGLTFPMTDVRAAAAFLVGLPKARGVSWYNLVADDRIAPDGHGLQSIPPADWLVRAPLTDAVRRLIAADPLILAADAQFDTAAAAAALPACFAALCNAPALIARRLYQREPALI